MNWRLIFVWLAFAALIVAGAFAHFASGAEEIPTPVSAPVVPLTLTQGRYIYGPSPVTGYASWVYESLTPNDLKGRALRNESFRADQLLPRDLRANAADYVGSGKDIGHLAASNNYHHVDDQRATFSLSNAAPQDPSLNRGLWARLEAQVVGWIQDDREVQITTIPLYRYPPGSKPTVLGRMIVPTDFGKNVLLVDKGTARFAYAWIVPNKDPGPHTADDFRVKPRDLEEVSLLDLNATVPQPLQDQLEASK